MIQSLWKSAKHLNFLLTFTNQHLPVSHAWRAKRITVLYVNRNDFNKLAVTVQVMFLRLFLTLYHFPGLSCTRHACLERCKMAGNISCYINYYIKWKCLGKPQTHDERATSGNSQLTDSCTLMSSDDFPLEENCVLWFLSTQSCWILSSLNGHKSHKEGKIAERDWGVGMAVCLSHMIELMNLNIQRSPQSWQCESNSAKGVNEACIAIN